MILYVNGDSHAAAAEAVNPHAFAEDDGMYWGMGRQPHPDNLRASFGCELANLLGAVLYCDAESASSNQRIIRTTRDWIQQNLDQITETLMVIQWSTWERQEWWIDNQWWQINASGIDDVPLSYQQLYKEFVVSVDWEQCTQQAHEEIWQFHRELNQQNIAHVFFNGNSHFGTINQHHDWGANYLAPYDPGSTYDRVLRSAGYQTVSKESWHFGADAHCFWAEYLLQYVKANNLVHTHAIPAD